MYLFFANKTRNLYEISKENYNKLLTENITKSYGKTTNKIYNNINKEAKAVELRNSRKNGLFTDDRFLH